MAFSDETVHDTTMNGEVQVAFMPMGGGDFNGIQQHGDGHEDNAGNGDIRAEVAGPGGEFQVAPMTLQVSYFDDLRLDENGSGEGEQVTGGNVVYDEVADSGGEIQVAFHPIEGVHEDVAGENGGGGKYIGGGGLHNECRELIDPNRESQLAPVQVDGAFQGHIQVFGGGGGYITGGRAFHDEKLQFTKPGGEKYFVIVKVEDGQKVGTNKYTDGSGFICEDQGTTVRPDHSVDIKTEKKKHIDVEDEIGPDHVPLVGEDHAGNYGDVHPEPQLITAHHGGGPAVRADKKGDNEVKDDQASAPGGLNASKNGKARSKARTKKAPVAQKPKLDPQVRNSFNYDLQNLRRIKMYKAANTEDRMSMEDALRDWTRSAHEKGYHGGARSKKRKRGAEISSITFMPYYGPPKITQCGTKTPLAVLPAAEKAIVFDFFETKYRNEAIKEATDKNFGSKKYSWMT